MGDDQSQLNREAEALGVILPADVRRPKVFKVWPENWGAVCLFLEMLTQWRMGPRGPVGLDYGVARWLFELNEVRDPRAMLADLRLMESAYMAELYGGAD